MRIFYLPKLISTESQTITLKNCPLVVDGNNFFYNSYRDNELPQIYGSEANEHAKHIKNMLHMFQKAGVELYFVFKGGTHSLDEKVKKLNKKLESEFTQERLFPIFAPEVIKQVLDELGIKYATSVLGAKEDCVALALALNCSVLSNDIQYSFMKAPYIPSKSLKYTPCNKFIKCQQYHVENFQKKFSVTDKKLAIFAVLSDITIFEQNHFNDLLKKWDVLDQNLYLQIQKLLKWLSNHTQDEVLNSITEFISNESEKVDFFNQVERIMGFMNCDGESVVVNYLMNRKKPISHCDSQWFAKGVASQKIAPWYINLCRHKCILGSWIHIKPTTNLSDRAMLSMDIIIYAYNLLMNFPRDCIRLYHNSENYTKIDTKNDISKPVYQCTESVFENGWKNIKSLKLFEHFLTLNDINTAIINKFPIEARMLFISLAYFVRKKTSQNIQVTKEVSCVIICYVLLHVVCKEKKSLMKVKSGISKEDAVAAINVTEKYFSSGKCAVDEKVISTLTELQYCLLHMNNLNSLCGSPFMTTKYHRTYNGTFIYNLLPDLNGSVDKDINEFINLLFKTAPSVLNFVHMLMSIYSELL